MGAAYGMKQPILCPIEQIEQFRMHGRLKDGPGVVTAWTFGYIPPPDCARSSIG